MPARSTTSNVAKVVFFGLNSALRRSTRSSGTRAIPACISPRAVPNDDVATLAPVRRLNSDVLPLLGSPTSPIFMGAHASTRATRRPGRGRGAAAGKEIPVMRGV